jgi:hypothetical protein
VTDFASVAISPLDAAMSVLATGALALAAYLAWARRRLARLEHADEVVTRALSQDEIDRILALAEELAAQGARRSETSPG